MSSARHAIYKLILPLLSALVAIALVELILVLFYPIPYSLERNMYFEPDPHTGYRHRPLAEGFYPNGITARANSMGFRDDEFSVEKPPGVYRVMVVGDSFTVGANVEQADAYPQVLERLLNTGGGKPIEVINAGTGGFDPFQYAQFVEYYAGQYEPDVLLLGFFVGNDSYSDITSFERTRTAVLGRRVNRNTGKGPAVILRVWAYENLNVARGLMNRGAANITFVRESCDRFTDYYLAVQQVRIRNHLANPTEPMRTQMQANIESLERIRDFAADNGIRFAIAILPDENQLNAALQSVLIPAEERGEYDFEMPQKVLRDKFDQAGIAYLDLLDDFRNDPRCLYMDDTHWITAGHEFAAQRIAEFLTTGGFLPPT